MCALGCGDCLPAVRLPIEGPSRRGHQGGITPPITSSMFSIAIPVSAADVPTDAELRAAFPHEESLLAIANTPADQARAVLLSRWLERKELFAQREANSKLERDLETIRASATAAIAAAAPASALSTLFAKNLADNVTIFSALDRCALDVAGLEEGLDPQQILRAFSKGATEGLAEALGFVAP